MTLLTELRVGLALRAKRPRIFLRGIRAGARVWSVCVSAPIYRTVRDPRERRERTRTRCEHGAAIAHAESTAALGRKKAPPSPHMADTQDRTSRPGFMRLISPARGVPFKLARLRAMGTSSSCGFMTKLGHATRTRRASWTLQTRARRRRHHAARGDLCGRCRLAGAA